jgi:hypothetical protein
MRKLIVMLLVLSVLSLNFIGCAALFNTDGGRVTLNSKPPDAEVFVDGHPLGRTPVTLELDRTTTHQVTIVTDGIERTYLLNKKIDAGWIILDVLAGLVPIIIDAATGSWYDLSPHYINAHLVPGAKYQAYKGTGKIGIRIQNQIVIAVTPGGSAGRAGLKVGDKILVADGVELNGEESLHDVSLITGEPGTTVILTIQRDDQVFEISVVRE